MSMISNIRRGERIKKRKRPYSPEVKSSEKLKKSKISSDSQNTVCAYDYDLDSAGQKFQCDRCQSNYIVHPSRKKCTNRTKKMPGSKKYTPRYKHDAETGKDLVLCNACGLKLTRPLKSAKVIKKVTHNEKQHYLDEAKQFTNTLQQQLKDKDAENLFCPSISHKYCGCVQNFIIGKGEDKNRLVLDRAKQLLEFCKQAKYLSTLRFTDNCSSYNQTECDGTRVVNRIGLGNGKKKSSEFLQFLLENRERMRKDFSLCEKACQKILGYSNNLLYKKLKTENNKCRLHHTEELKPVAEIATDVCCEKGCIKLAKYCEKLIKDWRERCELGQSEKRRVIAEMLTPVAGNCQNCPKFVQLVTGCSSVTIAKVAKHLKQTEWDREPPEHGLKKYWELQQNQKSATIAATESSSSKTEGNNPFPCKNDLTKKKVIEPGKALSSDTPLVTYISKDNISGINCHLYPTVLNNQEESYHSKSSLTIDGNNSILTILPTLEQKRDKILKLQKALTDKQSILKFQQHAIEQDMLQVLQSQKQLFNKEKKIPMCTKYKSSRTSKVIRLSSTALPATCEEMHNGTNNQISKHLDLKNHTTKVISQENESYCSESVLPFSFHHNDGQTWNADAQQMLSNSSFIDNDSHVNEQVSNIENTIDKTGEEFNKNICTVLGESNVTYKTQQGIPVQVLTVCNQELVAPQNATEVPYSLDTYMLEALSEKEKSLCLQNMNDKIVDINESCSSPISQSVGSHVVLYHSEENTTTNPDVCDIISQIHTANAFLMNNGTQNNVDNNILVESDIDLPHSKIYSMINSDTSTLTGSSEIRGDPHIISTDTFGMVEMPMDKSRDVLLSSTASVDDKSFTLPVENQLGSVSIHSISDKKILENDDGTKRHKSIKGCVHDYMFGTAHSNFSTSISRKKSKKLKRQRRHSVAIMNNVEAQNNSTSKSKTLCPPKFSAN